ncbi:hypothetical protein N2A98_10500 [Pseudomonas sp. FJ2-5-13]|uniref:hypothetical protein n=1 Tax=Pseudomonas sp. FJ2-5-13 TaxID=2976884 RepID=UPI0023D87CA9|nr:hypothetical protein [Pseudomonas sp. FJ2-5-13]WEJ07691.1 hypothetical protein N2A98_10500 [Pseudomonas sp. FJ2-5-13]
MERELIDEVEELIKKTNDAERLFTRYSTKCYTSALQKYAKDISETSYTYLLAELAESSLSSEILGRPGANISLVRIEIEEVMLEADVIKKLKRAETHYLETLESVRKFEDLKRFEKMQDTSDIVRSIKLGVSRFNILFVILLIGGLTWAAINLPKEALALISAAIGGAITHLLSERQAVLALKKEGDNSCPRANNNNQE